VTNEEKKKRKREGEGEGEGEGGIETGEDKSFHRGCKFEKAVGSCGSAETTKRDDNAVTLAIRSSQ
jgi:hypothetical protein